MTTAPTADDIFKRLSAPFPASEVQWKAGSVSDCGCWTIPIPFLTARSIQRRLDEVLGPMNWNNRFTEVVTGNRLAAIRCAISARVEGEWNTKEDGAHVDTSGRVEFLIKGAYSDSEKRAAVQWGIGRYLYSLQLPYVPCTSLGKVGSGFAKLDETPLLPPDCLPDDERAAGTVAWDAWQAAILVRDEEIQRQSREFEEKQRERAQQRSDEAMRKVNDISTNAIATHLPNTDEFSLREPLHSRTAVHQVADGEEPQSVASLLDSAANKRSAPAKQAERTASAADTTDTGLPAYHDTKHIPLSRASVEMGGPLKTAHDCPGDEPETYFDALSRTAVQAPEPAETPVAAKPAKHSKAAAAKKQADEPEVKDAECATARPSEAEAEVAAQPQPDKAVADLDHKDSPAEPATTPVTASISDDKGERDPTVVDGTARETPKASRTKKRVVMEMVKADSPLANCPYELEPEDDWKTFRDILTKIRTQDAALSILERFIQGPRTKTLLTDKARAYLQSDIERLRSL